MDVNLSGQVTSSDSPGNRSDLSDLVGQVESHNVDVICQGSPDTHGTLVLGLATQLTVGDLVGDFGDFAGEGLKLVHHGVDGDFDLQDLGVRLDRVDLHLLGQVTHGHGDDDGSYLRQRLFESLVCGFGCFQVIIQVDDQGILAFDVRDELVS